MRKGHCTTGRDYELAQKAVTITIMDFDCLPTDSYHSMFRIREEKKGFLLTDDLEIHFLELPKIKDEKARYEYEAREKALMDEVSMINRADREGEKRGLIKKATEIAQSMLKEGLDLGLIAKVTGLSVEELEKMKQTTI